MNDLVSVVIPVYKVPENFLRECMESVIAQNYTNIEIILVDDGSPDNCGRICDEYAETDTRVAVIHKQNEGVSEARNSGIKVAHGKYIIFIDSDDTVDRDYVEILLKNMKPNSMTVCSFRREMYRSDNSLHERIYTPSEAQASILSCQKLTISGAPFCKCFDLELIRKNRLYFDAKLKIGEDLIFCIKYTGFVSENVYFSNIAPYYYRNNPNSLMNNRLRKSNIKEEDIVNITSLYRLFEIRKTLFNDISVRTEWRLCTLSAAVALLRVLSINEMLDNKYAKTAYAYVKNNAQFALLNSNMTIKQKLSVLLSFIHPKLEMWVFDLRNKLRMDNHAR